MRHNLYISPSKPPLLPPLRGPPCFRVSFSTSPRSILLHAKPSIIHLDTLMDCLCGTHDTSVLPWSMTSPCFLLAATNFLASLSSAAGASYTFLSNFPVRVPRRFLIIVRLARVTFSSDSQVPAVTSSKPEQRVVSLCRKEYRGTAPQLLSQHSHLHPSTVLAF